MSSDEEIEQLSIERERSDEANDRLVSLKYQKARAKTAFAKTRNQLLGLLDDEDNPDRKQIKEIRLKVER